MLDGMGLTDAEEAVYIALVDLSSAGQRELTARCPGAGVPAALAGLERKGLVSRLPGSSVRYAPSPPDVALEVLARARVQLTQSGIRQVE